MAITVRSMNGSARYGMYIKELQTALAQAVAGTVEASKAVILSSAKTMTGLGGVFSTSPSLGIGYATGAGGAVTQITSRATTVVTVPAACMCGAITTDTSSLAAEVSAEFQVTNTAVAVGDVVVASIRSGTNGGNTAVTVSTVAAGSFKLRVSNNNAAGGTAETGAIIINFAVIKAVSA